MKIKKLFGEDIDISQEDFGVEVGKILKAAETSECGLSLLKSAPLTAVTNCMLIYKGMLESKEIDVKELGLTLQDIIDVSLRAYVMYAGSTVAEVYKELQATLIKKNADYGNSSVKNGGSVGNYVRMSDKLSRLQNLLGKEGKTNYESVNDTWLDLAGYATIGIIILDLTEKKLNPVDDRQPELPWEDAEPHPYGYEEKDQETKMDENLKTIFYFAGTSGAGKSTRVYALIRFLEDRGEKPTGYLYHNKIAVGREYLHSFYVIGKEITRNGKPAWQGLDSFIREINEGKGSEQLFKFFYETVRTQNLVLDSAAMLRSNRSRPLALEQYGVDAKTYSRFYWYDNFKEYQDRIAGRSQGKILTEDSSMWKTNDSMKRQGEMQAEEMPSVKHPERYEFFHGQPSEPVWTIGVDILQRVGHPELIEEFKVYADSFLTQQSINTVTTKESEDLF